MNLIVVGYSLMGEACIEVRDLSQQVAACRLVYRGIIPLERWDADPLASELATLNEGISRALDAVMMG